MSKLRLVENQNVETSVYVHPYNEKEMTEESLEREWNNRLAAMKKPLAKVHKKRSERKLECVLTTLERDEFVEEICKADRAQATLESQLLDLQEQSKFVKSTISSHDKTIRENRVILDRGTIMKPVMVETIINYDDGVVTEVRLDTGEEIQTRPLNIEEKQMKFEV